MYLYSVENFRFSPFNYGKFTATWLLTGMSTFRQNYVTVTKGSTLPLSS
jgi:hypothetical protein